MTCKHCGAPTKSEQKFCEFCGAEIERPQPQNITINNYNYASNSEPQNITYNQPKNIQSEKVSDKNKILALILCFLFGYFGIHHFYVGKKSMGVLYIFTMGLFGFGWFIDIILIATGAFKDKYGLKLK